MRGTRERSHLPTILDSCKQRRHVRKDLDPAEKNWRLGLGVVTLTQPIPDRKKGRYLVPSFKECFQRGHWQWGEKSRHLGSGELQEIARDFF